MGRKPKLTAHQRREALQKQAAGENGTDIARGYNVDHSVILTVGRLNTAALRPIDSTTSAAAGLES